MAEALGRHLASDAFESYSAGTELKDRINPDAVRIMKELYRIDMEAEGQHSKLLSDLPPVDGVITMGCNVRCPFLPCPGALFAIKIEQERVISPRPLSAPCVPFGTRRVPYKQTESTHTVPTSGFLQIPTRGGHAAFGSLLLAAGRIRIFYP